jgi:FkbM family methyltransferase
VTPLVLALGGALFALTAVIVRLRAQSRLLAVRMRELEGSTWDAYPGEPLGIRKRRLFNRFEVANQFEQDNILPNVVALDEYGVADLQLSAEDVVVDVGAHIGTFSYLCHILGSRSVHAFEPWPDNFELLAVNLASLPGVSLYPKAMWRSDLEGATVEIAAPIGDNTGSGSALRVERSTEIYGGDTEAAHPTPLVVETVALDDVLVRLGRVRLLKMDCEGSEFPIVLTSRELQRVERIVAEVHEVGPEAMSLLSPSLRVGDALYSVETLASHLGAAGFRVRTHPTSPRIHMLDARRSV